MERTSNGFVKFPKGKYIFKCRERPEKFKAGKSGHRYNIKFLVRDIDDDRKDTWTKKYSQNFFSWDIKPLLLAMGFEKDETGHVDWELDDLIGKVVEAEIDHLPSEGKNADPDKLWARMVNISEFIPF